LNALGPQARRVYDAIHQRITLEECAPGTRLPPHKTLAREFGVALMTARQALSKLEQEGLVVSEQGRGTFVRDRAPASVLTVAGDRGVQCATRLSLSRAGYRAVEASGPDEGLRALSEDVTIGLVLSDVCMPSPLDSIGFIRTLHHRWPGLPLAAITSSPQDLTLLHGTPECPILILSKPIQSGQINALLRLAFHRSSRDEIGECRRAQDGTAW
jgi:CheY-like chemotaxis protein